MKFITAAVCIALVVVVADSKRHTGHGGGSAATHGHHMTSPTASPTAPPTDSTVGYFNAMDYMLHATPALDFYQSYPRATSGNSNNIPLNMAITKNRQLASTVFFDDLDGTGANLSFTLPGISSTTDTSSLLLELQFGWEGVDNNNWNFYIGIYDNTGTQIGEFAMDDGDEGVSEGGTPIYIPLTDAVDASTITVKQLNHPSGGDQEFYFQTTVGVWEVDVWHEEFGVYMANYTQQMLDAGCSQNSGPDYDTSPKIIMFQGTCQFDITDLLHLATREEPSKDDGSVNVDYSLQGSITIMGARSEDESWDVQVNSYDAYAINGTISHVNDTTVFYGDSDSDDTDAGWFNWQVPNGMFGKVATSWKYSNSCKDELIPNSLTSSPTSSPTASPTLSPTLSPTHHGMSNDMGMGNDMGMSNQKHSQSHTYSSAPTPAPTAQNCSGFYFKSDSDGRMAPYIKISKPAHSKLNIDLREAVIGGDLSNDGALTDKENWDDVSQYLCVGYNCTIATHPDDRSGNFTFMIPDAARSMGSPIIRFNSFNIDKSDSCRLAYMYCGEILAIFIPDGEDDTSSMSMTDFPLMLGNCPQGDIYYTVYMDECSYAFVTEAEIIDRRPNDAQVSYSLTDSVSQEVTKSAWTGMLVGLVALCVGVLAFATYRSRNKAHHYEQIDEQSTLLG